MHKRQGELCDAENRARNPQRYRASAQGRVFPRVRIQNARSHVRLDQRGGLTITSKEQAPQKTMRGLFLMQRIVRDAEGHQYPYR